MTYQQTHDAYPLIYEMKIVAKPEFPEIVRTTKTFLDTDYTVAVVGHNMYAVTNMTDNSSSPGRITKFTRQDFHEHYFVAEDVCVGSLYNTYTVDSVTYPAKTKIQASGNYIYVMSLSNLGAGPGPELAVEQYEITGPAYSQDGYLINDLSLQWCASGLGQIMAPESVAAGDLFGFLTPSGASGYLWSYHYDISSNIVLDRIDIANGNLDLSIAVTGAGTISGLRIDQGTDQDLAITVNTANGIVIGHAETGLSDISFSGTQTITTNASAMPITHTIGNNTLVVYESDLNRISFADTTLQSSNYFSLPYYYRIDKTARFNEAYDADQYYSFTVTQNPLNPRFIYFAYITSANQIRVIKLYRHLTEQETNEYIIMWATAADGTTSAFLEDGDDFKVSNTFINTLHLTVDDCGDVYVTCRKGAEGLRMWKIREYILDFGQDMLGVTVNEDPTVFTRFLASITDNYTMLSIEDSFFAVAGFPAIGDVIVSDVLREGDDYHITFKYIDYDAFQTLDLLDSGLSVAETFNADLISTLQEIYGTGNEIAVLNFNPVTSVTYNGTRKTVTVIIPTNNLIKPCVVQGTEITAMDPRTGRPRRVLIDDIGIGDYVYNQAAKPVRVTSKTSDRIICDTWTAPHVIPPNYFGKDQPYKPLLISGDHGIRMSKGKIYPCNMKGAFRRIGLGTAVHYYNLALEDPSDFYIANGLLIESQRTKKMKV